MLNTILTIFLFSISILFCKAQAPETYTVKTGSNIYKQVPFDKIYLYPQFSPGKVISRDEKEYEVFLNYNTVSAEIEFLGEDEDTASLIDKFDIKLVTIGTDSFCYDNRFVKLGREIGRWKYGTENRFVVMKNKGKVENGLFYTKSNLGRTLKDWEQPLSLSDEVVIAKKQLYFIGDRFNRFWPLDKRNLMELFPAHSSDIKRFLRKNNLKLNSDAEVKTFLTFLNSLN